MPKIKSIAVYIFFVAFISTIFISKDISIAAADSPDYTIVLKRKAPAVLGLFV